MRTPKQKWNRGQVPGTLSFWGCKLTLKKLLVELKIWARIWWTLLVVSLSAEDTLTEFLEYRIQTSSCHTLPSGIHKLGIILTLSSVLSLVLDLGVSQSLQYASHSIVYSRSFLETTKCSHYSWIHSSSLFWKRLKMKVLEMAGAPYVHSILMNSESGRLIPDRILMLPREVLGPPLEA